MEDKRKKKKVVGSGVGVSPLRKERGKRSLHACCILFDCTHNTNSYGQKLISLPFENDGLSGLSLQKGPSLP